MDAEVPVWKELADPGPVKRFEVLKADSEFPQMVFDRLCEGQTLRMISSKNAPGLNLPKGAFFEWFTTAHADLYDAALKVRAADLALDALQASLDATPDDVAVKALQAKVALHLAARFDRARYGESVRVERVAPVGVDAALLGLASELLARVREPLRIAGGGELTAPAPRLPVTIESGICAKWCGKSSCMEQGCEMPVSGVTVDYSARQPVTVDENGKMEMR